MAVQTTTHTKVLYRNLVVNYLVTVDVDGIRSLYQIARHLFYLKNVNTLKKDLGDNYQTIISRFNKFIPLYEYTRQLRQMIRETTDKKDKEKFTKELQEHCMRLPVINESIIIIFECLVKNTDLKDIPPQHPTVRDSMDNKMPLSFEEQ